MTDFPTLLFTSASEIPTLSYTSSLKIYLFRAEPPHIGPYRESYGVPPPPGSYLKSLAIWECPVGKPNTLIIPLKTNRATIVFSHHDKLNCYITGNFFLTVRGLAWAEIRRFWGKGERWKRPPSPFPHRKAWYSGYARSHWLLRGHMTSNNETDSCQTLCAGSIANNLWR